MLSLTISPCVVHADPVPPARGVADVAAEQPTLGKHTGFDPLQQSLITLRDGAAFTRHSAEAEEVLFVVEGRGELSVRGETHALEPECGVYLPPGRDYEIQAHTSMRMIRVCVPDPSPGPPSTPTVRRLADEDAQAATTGREFRILADPQCGLRSATHFVGEIPPQRAPEHFHTYDEVIYVLTGEGAFHAGEIHEPVGPGSCIQLPSRTVHSLENTGTEPMRVLALFRPAGSPATAYFPDGTPAYAPGGGRPATQSSEQTK